MNMTDIQFKSHLRDLIEFLVLALEKNPDNEIIKKMIERYQKNLED